MTAENKLPLNSSDVTAEMLAQLRVIAPHVFTEGTVDFNKLKATFGENIVQKEERYGMNWAGKLEAFCNLQTPSVGTLLPQSEESINFESCENVIIEGDNLEVLKLLQKSYHGKVKMIYIDPPYNTGNEFIYPDKFHEGLEDYLKFSGQVDAEGFAQSSNTETSGRFHSKWLNMMYPRLFLARNLLREDGVIFVSIDDNEVHNLRMLMNEVFGEENFVAQFVWSGGRKNDSRLVSVSHEYILCFVRSNEQLRDGAITWRQKKEGISEIYQKYDELKNLHGENYEEIQSHLKAWFRGLSDDNPSKAHSHYSAIDEDGIYFPSDISWPGGGGPKYTVTHPKTGKPCKVPSRGWMFSKHEKMQQAIAENRVHFGEDEQSVPCIKSPLREREYQVPYSVFYQDGRAATKRLRALFDGVDVFDHPKDERIIKSLIEFTTDEDSLILDFFAGSGTTAHSVLEQNKADGGNRRFILVQLPEKIDSKNYLTIADITRERVRRVIKKISEDAPITSKNLGFRAFKLAASNFKIWNANTTSTDEAELGKQLRLYADNVERNRTSQDVLYELVLKSGLPLSAVIEQIEVDSKSVYSIAQGQMLICLENEVDQKLLRGMIALSPIQMVCLDRAFGGNDQLKTNTVLEAKSQDVTFRTV